MAVEHGENHTPAVDVVSKAVAKKRAAVTGVKEVVSRVAVRLADREAESTKAGTNRDDTVNEFRIGFVWNAGGTYGTNTKIRSVPTFGMQVFQACRR